MKKTAIIFTDGYFRAQSGKTAHGLVRGSKKYEILAVIDSKNANQDAGQILDGIHRNIPIYSDLTTALNTLPQKPDCAIIGIAVVGGKLSGSLKKALEAALEVGLDVVNGLHTLLSEDIEFAQQAQEKGVSIVDIRKPKAACDLKHWSGAILDVNIPRLAVFGTDCAVGKRTTCQFILELCRKNNISAEMIFTGQTGWLQEGQYGFILDSTLNDFVSGELEHAVVTCAKKSNPDLMLLEGQSALRHPAGPCGAELICSAQVQGVILQHAPAREYFLMYEELIKIPPIEEEIELIQLYGARVLAITLNTKNLKQPWQTVKQEYSDRLGLPVVCPLEEGVDDLLEVILGYQHEN